MSKVYARQTDENTYYLVDEYGHSVDPDGELVYHPCFYHGNAVYSSFPVYYEKENQN